MTLHDERSGEMVVTMQSDEALTVSAKEAAERLGIGLATVYRLLRQRKIPALEVGRRPNFRIPVKVIEKIMEEPASFDMCPDEEEEET